jgi:hypothetical protein
MLWSLSGDGPYTQETGKWEAVGAAVQAADPYDRPTTNHLPPDLNWQFAFAHSPWHDFTMLQTGHTQRARPDISALPAAYWRRLPAKAVVNGEPWYEAHPARDSREYGPPFSAADARYAFWVSTLSGATMGHTYGSQGIWNWKRPGDDETEVAGPQIGPPWFDALRHAGAEQCGLGARLLRTLPWWQLEPAPERVRLDPPPSGPDDRPCCARTPDGLWVVYLPAGTGRPLLSGIAPDAWQARWVDPRTGAVTPVGEEIAVDQSHRWRGPAPPSADDWVLIVSRSG